MLLAALPAAAGLVGDASGFLKSAASFVNPGAARDADRLARANWMKEAALRGSVLAAQIVIAAPANVGSNEDPYWIAAAEAIKTQAPAVWSEAVSRNGFWPVGAPFDMPNERARIASELSAIQVAAPSGTIPSGQFQGNQINTAIANTVQQAAAVLGNNVAQNIDPTTSRVTVPTNTTTLLLIGAAVVAVIFFARKR